MCFFFLQSVCFIQSSNASNITVVLFVSQEVIKVWGFFLQIVCFIQSSNASNITVVLFVSQEVIKMCFFPSKCLFYPKYPNLNILISSYGYLFKKIYVVLFSVIPMFQYVGQKVHKLFSPHNVLSFFLRIQTQVT